MIMLAILSSQCSKWAINVFKATYSVVLFRSHDSSNNIGIDTQPHFYTKMEVQKFIRVSVSELMI